MLDTLDFIKKSIYFSNLVIQIIYIIYLVFRIYNQMGYALANLGLLLVTVSYLLYYVFKRKEFYTSDETDSKKFIKNVIKNIKRLIHLCLIIIAVTQLNFQASSNDNMLLLITVLMILGFLFSIFLDLLQVIIDKRIELVKNSVLYDVEKLRSGKKLKSAFFEMGMKGFNVDLDELFPKVENGKKIKAIKDVHDKQKNKAMRKRRFKKLNKRT